MLELNYLTWFIIFIVVGLITVIFAGVARIKRDGLRSTNTTYIDSPYKITGKDDCNADY